MGFPILPHGSYTGRLKGFDGRSLYFEKEEEKKAVGGGKRSLADTLSQHKWKYLFHM